MTEYFNYSPSEFAFGFEGCQRCYYDKKVNGILCQVEGFDKETLFWKVGNNPIEPEPREEESLLCENIP